jgi:hypothetical protein
MDAEERSERARNAALVAAKYRQAKTMKRDVGLLNAYRWLTGNGATKRDDVAGIEFLKERGLSPNLPRDETVLRYLAKATNLTTERIRQIISKYSNEISKS